MTIQLKRNDTKDTISYSMTYADGTPVDLSGATVRFLMGSGNKVITNASASIVGASTGEVAYTLTESDSLVSGTFRAEFEVTFSDGKIKTFPNNGYIMVNIQANIDKDQSTYIEDQIAYRVSDIQVLKNEIQAQIDQFVTDGVTDQETAQARVEADGTTNTTLKARLDKKEAEFSQGIADNAAQMAQKVSQVNGVSPDANGNVTIEVSGGASSSNYPELADSLSKHTGQNVYQNIPKRIFRMTPAKKVFFPSITTVNGKMLMFYRIGDTHTSLDGVIRCMESTDGITWSNERTIVDDTTNGKDSRDPNVILTSAGTLVLKYFDYDGNVNNDKVYVKRSIDNGLTWDSRITLPLPTGVTGGNATRGNMVQLSDGTILAVLYLVTNYAYVVKSTDDGLTWSYVGYLHETTKLNEVSLEYSSIDKKVYAVGRQGKQEDGTDRKNKLLICESSDNGVTWTNHKELPVYGHAPALKKIDDSRIILSYKNPYQENNLGGINFEHNMVILKRGSIDSQVLMLERTNYSDSYYSDVTIFNNKVFIATHSIGAVNLDVYYESLDFFKNLNLISHTHVNPTTKIKSNNGSDVVLDDVTNDDHMFYLPAFNIEDVVGDSSLGTGLHPAFKVNGALKKGIWIGKYQNYIDADSGKNYSMPSAIPKEDTYDNHITASKYKGAGWHMMTIWEWSAITLWCLKNGFQPKGNTSRGRSSDSPFETAIVANGTMALPGTSSVNKTLTGTGPNSWRHNGQFNGIADLVGNLGEWLYGVKIIDGQIYLLARFDGTNYMPDNDFNIDESNWWATGVYINYTGAKAELDTSVISTSTSFSTSPWVNMTVSANYDSLPLGTRQALCLAVLSPKLASANTALSIFSGLKGAFYVNNSLGEYMFARGGGYAFFGNAGLGTGDFRNARSSAFGQTSRLTKID